MENDNSFIPYGRQSIDDVDIAAVNDVLRQPFLTQGPTVERFERALCEYTGAKYCVAVSNGTAALHLAVAVLGIKQGCTGITSPITFLASSNAIIYSGLRPMFADIDPNTINVSPDSLRKAIGRDTRIIIPVHFAGRPAVMKEIEEIAARKKCLVIEDAAHAIGSRYPDGGMVGNCAHSEMTVFSFHPVKTITTGEGGAIMTNDKTLYNRLLSMRSHGIVRGGALLKKTPGPWYYEMRELGFNYRLTDIQAALGISQLAKIGSFISRRQEIAEQYDAAFRDLPWMTIPSRRDPGCALHLYVVRVNFKRLGISRKEMMEKLSAQGVGSQVHYIPVYRQPFYRRNYKSSIREFPAAERYYAECLSLPLFFSMTNPDVTRVVGAVRSVGNGIQNEGKDPR